MEHCVDDFVIEVRAAVEDEVSRCGVVGNALRNCWITQALVGCLVTWQCRIRRRSCAITKKQYGMSKVIVGTVKRSIAAMGILLPGRNQGCGSRSMVAALWSAKMISGS